MRVPTKLLLILPVFVAWFGCVTDTESLDLAAESRQEVTKRDMILAFTRLMTDPSVSPEKALVEANRRAFDNEAGAVKLGNDVDLQAIDLRGPRDPLSRGTLYFFRNKGAPVMSLSVLTAAESTDVEVIRYQGDKPVFAMAQPGADVKNGAPLEGPIWGSLDKLSTIGMDDTGRLRIVVTKTKPACSSCHPSAKPVFKKAPWGIDEPKSQK